MVGAGRVDGMRKMARARLAAALDIASLFTGMVLFVI
jgi:hypothetical protein